MNEQKYHIGQVSKKTGASPRAIRFWEQRGLIGPLRRSFGGNRIFTDADIARIEAIRFLQAAGWSLAEMQEGNAALIERALFCDKAIAREAIERAVAVTEDAAKRHAAVINYINRKRDA